ncbi:Alkaline phosphatase synthesis sensor protein PhoR [compost metagenome]
MKGYTKVVKDGLYETEGERDLYLDIIHEEAHRLEHLVEDLFELAKMEEGKITLTLDWIDLKHMAEQAVRRVELKAKEKGLQLKIMYHGDSYRVRGDEKRMEQIMMNLLENAIRYTDEGEITVHVNEDVDGDSAVFIVEDTGIGIPEEELPYVFERFYRVEKSRSRQYGGTGLGLSIVKKLVELHGGKIRITSQPGVGTRCEVRLPRLTKSEK